MNVLGETYNKSVTPVKRSDFVDYFSENLGKEYKGYIQQDVIKNQFKNALTKAMQEAKCSADMLKASMKATPISNLNPLYFKPSQREVESFEHGIEVQYMHDFRERLDEAIGRTTWVFRNKEHNYAEDLDRMGNEYLLAAGKAVTVEFIKGKVAGSMAKPLKKVITKKYGRSLVKIRKTNRQNGTFESKISNFLIQPKIAPKKWYFPFFESNLIDYGIDKAVDVSESGWQQIGDAATNNSISKLTPRGIDASFDNELTRKAAAYNQKANRVIGIAMGNPLLVATSFVPASTQTKIMDEVLSLSPHVLAAKTAVNLGMDLLLSREYKSTAKRVKTMQDENEEHWQHLSEDIKRCIKADVRKLSDSELMDLCGLLGVK